MEIRDRTVYDTIKGYIKGVCDNSLEWGPGRPKFEDLLNFLGIQNCVINTIHWFDPDAETKGEISRWTRAFSHVYQEKLGGLVWDEKVFNEVYESFENFLYSEKLMMTSVAPMFLFKCALKEPVEFDAHTGIIPKEFDVNIRQLLNRFDTEGRHFSEDYEWCVYARRKVSKAQQRESALEDREDTLKMADVLTSLRLLHSGLVHTGPVHSNEGSPFAGIQGGSRTLGHSMFKRLPADYIVFHHYTLEQAEIERLQQIYNRLRGLNPNQRKFLDVALGRFNDSYERRSDIDKLIDLCIALESLYVRESDELAYHLALRCACFLEQEKTEIEKTFRNVRDIYKSRSGIVHGTGKRLAERELLNLVTEAEEYVRRSVCKLLSNIHYIDSISKKLQENEVHFLDKIVFDVSARNSGC